MGMTVVKIDGKNYSTEYPKKTKKLSIEVAGKSVIYLLTSIGAKESLNFPMIANILLIATKNGLIF